MWASRAAAAANKAAPPPAVVRGGPVPTPNSPAKRPATTAGGATPTRKPRVEAKLVPVSQYPDAQISQTAPEICWTPELALDDAAALANAATALHATVHGLLEEDRDTKWATAKLSARLELTRASTAGKWRMAMSVDPVMWLNQILPQVVPEAAQREALAQAYVAANPDPAAQAAQAQDPAAAQAAAAAAANAKVPLTCWYCTIPNCDGACESKQSAERGSLPIVHPDYLCMGPVCSSNKDETCCAWYSKKELIILDSWCKANDATKAYIVEARRELIREIMMFPRPIADAEAGNHKNSCQLMCDVNTWRAAAALVARVPCELIAINLGRWESFMHKNKNAWECHGQMHFYVEKAFVDLISENDAAADVDLVNLKGHNGDPTDYNVHNIRALAKYLHHTTTGSASGAKSPEKAGGEREKHEKVKPISAPDADGWQEVVVGRGKGAKAGGRGGDSTTSTSSNNNNKTPSKTGK